MKNNNNSVEKHINRMHYENYMHEKLLKMENNETQVSNNEIKTFCLGLTTLAIVNKYDVKESPSENSMWIIKSDKNTEDFYRKYKNKEFLVEPVVYSRTLLNLITKK